MERYCISVTVCNKVGVLNRLTSMFSRLQINIVSLSLLSSDNDDFAEVCFGFNSSAENKKLLVNRLRKIYDVCSVTEKPE